MKPLAIVIMILGPIFTAGVAYLLDVAWGMLAYTGYYLTLSVISATSMAVFWRVVAQKHYVLAGLGGFLIMIAPLYFPPPATRVLVTCMLSIPPGTDMDLIEPMVRSHFEGTGYVMPQIRKSSITTYERIDVSLLSHNDGNCSAITFLCRDGKVADRWFSPD